MVQMQEAEELRTTEGAGALAEVKTVAPEKSAQHPEKFDLRQVEKDLFDFFAKISDSIPDWVPVVAPYLKAKKAEWEAAGSLHGIDLATGERIENKPEALKLFIEKTLSGLWHEGKTVVDLLLIFGTGGSGNVVMGAEKIAAEKMAGSAAQSVTVEKLGLQIAKLAKGGEGAALDLLPGFFKGLAEKLANHPEQAGHLLEMARVFEKIQTIPGARKLMETALSQQKWWKELKAELQSSNGRVANAQRIVDAMNGAGFTMAPNPV